jgi:predicted TPR repeat methyltransferase
LNLATDILPFLRTQCTNESIDLILSADVWIYVGELEEIFMLCASRLKKKGWFAFSIELLYVEEEQAKEKALFKLAMSGRFQHTHRYIEQLACENNLRIHYQEDIQVRKESGEPIPGRIYLLQRL